VLVEPPELENTFLRVTEVARLWRLTVYDAHDLELADRRGLPLATLDDAVRAAAHTANVALFRVT
jgi:predicted nucleic acid-binding protein